MVRLWLRNEVFDGVLPLKSMGGGAVHGTSAIANTGSQAGDIMTPLLALVRSLRHHHPYMVGYTTWIAEGWRCLHWSEPAAKLFWEMLTMYDRASERRSGPPQRTDKAGRLSRAEIKVQRNTSHF
jgi:hypothetical protein